MEIKIKKLHPDAIIPQYATPGAACFDLHAFEVNNLSNDELKVLKKIDEEKLDVGARQLYYCEIGEVPEVFRTGLAFEIPVGHVMLVFSRSGHGFNNDVRLSNCTGVIDSDYRGEVKVKLARDTSKTLAPTLRVSNGDRIAQAMIIPVQQVSFLEVEELSETERGVKGFGSTGT